MRKLASLVVLGLFVPSTLALAQPPAGRGRPDNPGRGLDRRVERALDSRAALFERRGLDVPAGLDRANGAGLGNRPIEPGTGTGRLGSGSLRDRVSVLREQRGAAARANLERRRERFGSTLPSLEDTPFNDAEPPALERRGNERSREVSHGLNRRAYTLAEKLLAKRLAQIDHLRDIALENGNLELMDRADQLEQLARRQYDRRIEGREPAPVEPVEPPVGDDPATNPLPPETEPIGDPTIPIEDPEPTVDPTVPTVEPEPTTSPNPVELSPTIEEIFGS